MTRPAHISTRIGLLALAALGAPLCPAAPPPQPATSRLGGWSGRYPDATPPVHWSRTENVAWVTPMTNRGCADPIIVGDRLFVTAEPYWLICLDKKNGSALWQRANGEDDVLAPDSKREYLERCRKWFDLSKKRFQAELDKIRTDRKLVELPDDAELKAESARLKTAYHRYDHERGRFPQFHRTSIKADIGNAACTPVSDGETVFALFGNGVGVAYDLKGDIQWSKFLSPATLPQGQSMSPAMAGGVIGVHFDHEFHGIDLETGKTLWIRHHARSTDWKTQGIPGGSPAPVTIDGAAFFVTAHGVLRATDGVHVAKSPRLSWHAPAICDSVVWYMLEGKTHALEGSRLTRSAEGLQLKRVTGIPLPNPSGGRKFSLYASPLVDGNIACVYDRGGSLMIFDLKSKTALLDRNVGLGEGYQSPVAAGRFIYIAGTSGKCSVLEKRWKKKEVRPGEFRQVLTFPEVARNQLEPFRANLLFQGDRLYVRGHRNLYCIAASVADRKLGKPIDAQSDQYLDDLENFSKDAVEIDLE